MGGEGLLRSCSRGSWSCHCHQNHHQTFVMLLSQHHAPQETALPCPSQLLHCYLSLVPHRGCLVHPALGSPPELPGPSVRDSMSVPVVADVCLSATESSLKAPVLAASATQLSVQHTLVEKPTGSLTLNLHSFIYERLLAFQTCLSIWQERGGGTV